MYNHKIVYCYQAQAGNGNSTFNEAMEYIDQLAQSVNAECAMFTVTKHTRTFEKKYGYKPARTVMVKNYKLEVNSE